MITENKNGRVTQIFTVTFDHSNTLENTDSSRQVNQAISKGAPTTIITSKELKSNQAVAKNKYL